MTIKLRFVGHERELEVELACHSGAVDHGPVEDNLLHHLCELRHRRVLGGKKETSRNPEELQALWQRIAAFTRRKVLRTTFLNGENISR